MDTFDLTIPDLKATHGQIEANIKAWNDKWAHVLRGDLPRNESVSTMNPTRSQGPSSPAPARLLCRPEFDETEAPVDPSHRFDFPEERIMPFEQVTELLDAN